MKKLLRRSRKLYLAASALLFAAAVSAQSDEKADPCEGLTYQWIDEYGDIHTSPYLETATHPNQMKALVASLYVDRNIPGQKKFFYNYTDTSRIYYRNGVSVLYKDVNLWHRSPDGHSRTAAGINGNYWVDMTYYLYKDLKFDGKPSTFNEWRPASRLYAQCEGIAPMLSQLDFSKVERPEINIYTADRADITPYEDGKTALLIEMTDDYRATEDKDAETAWSHIKSITVLPFSRQYRVDHKTDETRSGYMFNINRPLNKFFVALKGDIMASRVTSTFCGIMPLTECYEQIAPGLEIDEEYAYGKYVENAYPEMLDGKCFPVSHDCLCVPYRAHATMMGSKDDTELIPANMLVWLPDYRNVDKTLMEINKYTNPFLPYYFIPNLKIEASIRSVETDRNVTVDVDWTSSIKSVTKDNEPERYRLLRSYDGVNFTEVPADEIITVVTDGAVMDDATGYYTYADGATVAVRVREKQYSQPHKVYYKSYDRYANTEFDEFESNIAEVEIPGYRNSTPKLTIALDHKSVFDVSMQRNTYTNRIDFVLANEAADGIKNENVGADGTLHLELRRYTNVRQDVDDENFAINQGTKIATGVITKTGEADGTVTYSVELFGTLSEPEPLYTGTLQAAEGEQLHIAGANNGGDVWACFTDVFGVDVSENADGSTYAYRLFATDVRKAEKNDVTNLEGQITEYTVQIGSNIVDVTMPVMDHGCGFTDYSLEEIKADKERLRHELAASVCQLIFMPKSDDAKVVECKISEINNGQSGTLLAKAGRTLQGYWVLTSSYDDNVVPVSVKLGKAAVNADPDVMGKATVMTISRGTNTYGTPRRVMPYLPQVGVDIVEMAYCDDHYENGVDLTVSLDPAADANFRSYGYGVWHKENIIGLYGHQNEILDPSHNKHNTPLDSEGLTFSYCNGTPATAHEGNTIFGGNADARIVHIRPVSDRGTKRNPYAMWYLARYYSRYIAEPEGDTGGVAKAVGEPRYVIVEDYMGAREEGDNVVTGTSATDIIRASVYPTVTADIVNIDGEGPVAVYNLQGMVVATLGDNSGTGDSAGRTVSLGHLPAGLYIISLNGTPFKVLKR